MLDVKSNRFRTTLPQIIASTVTTLLLLDIGLSVSYPTVVISALTGLNNATNPDETLQMSAVQVSWMGSIGYLGKLFGSFFCGFASEYFGRRKSMILINFPHLIAFYLFYYSTSVWRVFAANILLGFGSGFMKAPCSTYVAEISEVAIRGVLVSMSSIAITIGPLIVFAVGNFTAWRNIALYCCVVQIMTTIALCFVPESPMWLLSKQRDDAALKSLRWLRGWVPQNVVQVEFDAVKKHKEMASSCDDCKKQSTKCTHAKAQTASQGIKELIRKRTLKPFFILFVTSTVAYFSGTHHMVSYMVQILNTYHSPMSPNWATVVVASTGLGGTVAGIVGIKMLGKRKLYLLALFGVTFSSFILSIYGFVYLPPNSKSYEHKRDQQLEGSIIPLTLFCSMRFFTTITLLVPFTMLSELYSLKSRSMGTAVSTALNNIVTFAATKSFYNLEHWLNLPSTLGIYCAIGVIGLIVAYLILPETEGRTLEEIETHFSDDNRKLTDRYIERNAAHVSKDKNPS